MEQYKEAAQYAADALKRAGADEAECYVRCDDITEINVDDGDFSLMRTYSNKSLILSGLKDKKHGKSTAARIDKASIDDAVTSCIAGMASGKTDESYAIAEPGENGNFTKGPLDCDYHGMLSRTAAYADFYQKENNKTLDEYIISHVHSKTAYCNTNGVDLSADQGWYQIGGRSGNLFAGNMNLPLSEIGKVNDPFDKKLRSQDVKPLGGKFEGTLIYHPRFIRREWWLAMFVVFGEEATLGENGAKKNKWVDKLGEMVASPIFNFSNTPLDKRFYGTPFFTADGYLSKNIDFIKNGKLVNLPADRRVARKLSLPVTMPPVNYDNDEVIKCNFFIQPGKESIQEIIKGVKRGIIVEGLPGCVPQSVDSGDINSIIRGGLLIEDGVVTRPVSEVMVAGNYFDKFRNIRGISSEYRFSGGDIIPWIAFDGFIMQ